MRCASTWSSPKLVLLGYAADLPPSSSGSSHLILKSPWKVQGNRFIPFHILKKCVQLIAELSVTHQAACVAERRKSIEYGPKWQMPKKCSNVSLIQYFYSSGGSYVA